MNDVFKSNGIAASCIYQSHSSPAQVHEYHCRDKKHTLFESIQDNVSDANISEGIRHSTVKGSPLKSIDGWPPADTDLHEQSRFVFHADRSVDTKYPKSIQANDKMASPAKAHSFPQDRVHEDHSGAPFRHKSTPQLLAECGVHLLESVPISCQQFASVLW